MRKTAYDQLLFLAQVDPVVLFNVPLEALKVLISQCQHQITPISFSVEFWASA